MAHTYCCSLFHCVFSTKERRRSISSEIQPRLWPYIGGIARKHGMKALSVGGSDDHVHILLSIPTSVAIAEAMRIVKAESSRWMHETCGNGSFEWQEGYGAFSIGCSQTQATLAYIASQQEHHKKHDFQADFIAFLKRTTSTTIRVMLRDDFGRPCGTPGQKSAPVPGGFATLHPGLLSISPFREGNSSKSS